MNYSKIYDKLITRAQTRILDCYVESHHIIPRCMNGGDNKENLVNLTPEEHYVAHQLLAKMYPENHNLIFACIMMCPSKGRRSNNKLYGWVRRNHAKSMSINAKDRLAIKKGFASYDDQVNKIWNLYVNLKTPIKKTILILGISDQLANKCLKEYATRNNLIEELNETRHYQKSIVSKNTRNNISHDKEVYRIEMMKKSLKNRKVDDRNGGKNPASVEVSINGIVYNCMKDASNKLNLPYHTIVNKVNSKLHKTWYRIKT